jgi:large subunit ribosomal protein L19
LIDFINVKARRIMSFELINKVNEAQKKSNVVEVRSGDTVRVHQKIKEGAKERIQIFEGVVIRTDRKNSHTSRITVRKIASGVGVEKSFYDS